jgi:hypothetical protein
LSIILIRRCRESYFATACRSKSRAPSLPSSGRNVRRVTFQPSLLRVSSQRLVAARELPAVGADAMDAKADR